MINILPGCAEKTFVEAPRPCCLEAEPPELIAAGCSCENAALRSIINFDEVDAGEELQT
jgi:hypothetical protein